ncbi:hypothetical protein PCANC_14677 [Puccinia coronata f. sp. avenae]|uniref:Threonine/serine exporter-like N-terminal domain-containing protein n=1 Tax=Puccinia coronata f. sp. avenae TaxID=200324 RepID=A0A2N5UCJ8_9BASI|nr:hypothetical protein PCANC_14677 [Puccinia coronata f. sp. avenae]
MASSPSQSISIIHNSPEPKHRATAPADPDQPRRLSQQGSSVLHLPEPSFEAEHDLIEEQSTQFIQSSNHGVGSNHNSDSGHSSSSSSSSLVTQSQPLLPSAAAHPAVDEQASQVPLTQQQQHNKHPPSATKIDSTATLSAIHPNTPLVYCSTGKEPPVIIVPSNLDPLSTSSSSSTTPHKKRRVQWVGLRERDSTELDDWPSSSSHQSHQPHQSPSYCKSDSGTDPLPDHLYHYHPHHPHHHPHPNSLAPNNSSSASHHLSRPFSIRLPDRPTLEQLSQQVASQRANSTRRHHLVQQQNQSDSRENSTSSLALSTNLNTRANSSSASKNINPYFPSIPSKFNHQSVDPSNSHPHNLYRSPGSRIPYKYNPPSPRDASYLPTGTTPNSNMATPDQSRPGTPDSDLDIPFGERDGLPSNPNRKPRTFTREAANLVSLHKFNMTSALGRSHHPGQGLGPGKRLGTAASHNATVREHRALGINFNSSTAGASRSGFKPPGMPVGNGVLSSLLHLYNHPSSAQSSSATLINYGSDDDSDGAGGGSQSAHSHGRHSSTDSNHARSKQVLPTHRESSDPNNQAAQGSPNNNQASSGRSSFDAIVSTRQKIVHGFSKVAKRFDLERPPTARSNAGVFGALQASAMALGGVAAPAANNIAPAVNKSGFRLARYTNAAGGDASENACPITPSLTLTSDDPYGEMVPAPSREDDNVAGPPRRVSSAGILVRRHSEDGGLITPDLPSFNNGRGGPDRMASSASSSVGSIFKTRIHQSSSMASLKALGDAMKPTNFHNESAVLKAKKSSGSVSGSTPGTPSKEFCGSEKSPANTPMGLPPNIYNFPAHVPVKAHQHNQIARRRREKRRQEEIFITMHVAAILQRQQFILQLTRALMMFGGPSHRLESQVLATARVLEIDLQVVLIYSICIFSFQDEATHTSETKFIKQSPNVDLGKLTDLATLHWEVVHDKIGVQEASQEISRLMRAPPEYKHWQTILIGGLCSAFIGPAAFSASFLDVLISAPLGAGLVAAQLFVANKSDVLSQIFEIVVTGFTSFVAAGLASTGYFCYSAVIASSIVLILPGWLVCCAALELQSRSIVSGSVRLIWAVIYALFLGLGISVGAEFWTLFSGKSVQVSVDGTCGMSHNKGKWYQTTIPMWSMFIVVPGYALFLAMRQQARLYSKEIWVMVLLASGGFTANHFASLAFPNRSDISSALGSFVVGFLANIYGRLFQGTSFIVALVPILFQLPSGLGNGGLLYFANTSDSSHSFTSGFQVGQQLLEVSLGLVIGLFVATVIVYPFGNRRGGIMAF